jgi:predicted nuclease of predicted toxin-antitoxin system
MADFIGIQLSAIERYGPDLAQPHNFTSPDFRRSTNHSRHALPCCRYLGLSGGGRNTRKSPEGISGAGRRRHYSSAGVRSEGIIAPDDSSRVTLNFLVDANLPDRLVTFLREQGYVAQHVRRMRLPLDTTVWAKAIELDAVLITQDKDFLALLELNPRARLILDTRGNRPFATIMSDYQTALPILIEGLGNGDRLIELS